MICNSPIWIENESLIKGGDIVPCGKCIYCLENKRSVWTFRIMQELEVAETARFVTLTYDEKYLPWINEKKEIKTLWEKDKSGELEKSYEKNLEETLNPTDLRSFIKKLRKEVMNDHWELFKKNGAKIENLEEGIRYVKKSEKTGKWSPKIRYFACGEYGTKGRPHFHIILFNVPFNWYLWDNIHREEYSPKLEKLWGKGIIDIGLVERGSAHYVAKYTIKFVQDEWEDDDIRVKPFAVMSRNPGIGNNYINDDNRRYHISTKNYHTRLKGGYIQPIGRYLKEKLYEQKPLEENWEIEFETGYKYEIENRLFLRNRDETETIRKSKKFAYDEKRKKENKAYRRFDGDIQEGDRWARTQERRAYEANKLKQLNRKNKGRTLC